MLLKLELCVLILFFSFYVCRSLKSLFRFFIITPNSESSIIILQNLTYPINKAKTSLFISPSTPPTPDQHHKSLTWPNNSVFILSDLYNDYTPTRTHVVLLLEISFDWPVPVFFEMLVRLVVSFMLLGVVQAAINCDVIPTSLWCSSKDIEKECGFTQQCDKWVYFCWFCIN